jgi:hypothetical protein
MSGFAITRRKFLSALLCAPFCKAKAKPPFMIPAGTKLTVDFIHTAPLPYWPARPLQYFVHKTFVFSGSLSGAHCSIVGERPEQAPSEQTVDVAKQS